MGVGMSNQTERTARKGEKKVMYDCKSARTQLPLVCSSALFGLSMLLVPIQRAEASCAVGEGGTLGVDNLGPVHIGDTITVTTVELANLLTSFQATNFDTFVVF